MMNKLGSFFQNEDVVAVLLSLIALIVYRSTMSPTVTFVDSGELSAVASTLGIAHPTGYPLFTLLGRCASMIPLASEEIVRLNFLPALLTAAAVGWFFKTAILLLRSKLFSNHQEFTLTSEPHVAAAFGALVLAFSSTFWSQSVAVEVYALHVLILTLTTYFFLKGLEEQKSVNESVSKSLLLFAFVLGLGFTNHMTVILLAPAFLFLSFRVLGVKRASVLRLLKLAPFFLLGLSLYLYLPVRANVQPPIDWGYPSEFERFIWHLTGKQYRSWMFSSFDSAEKQFQYFTNNLPSEFHYITLVVLAVGILAVIRRSGRLFFFLALMFSSCLLYAINYDIHDIDSYFLLAYLALGWFVVFGIFDLQRWLSSILLPKTKFVAWVLVLCLPAIQWLCNRSLVDQSNNFLVQDYTQNIFSAVAPDAFILTFQWDYFVSSSYYYQNVKKQRPDVVVIDKELLRRSWYYLMLERKYPRLIERSRTKVNQFLAELYKFEHELPYDPAVIESRYNEMINDFIDKAMEVQPVYVGSEIEPQLAFNYQRVPEGLLFRLVRENESLSVKPISVTYRPTSFENEYTRGVRFLYARMLTMNAALMQEQNQVDLALRTVNQVLTIDSTYQPARKLRDQLLAQSSQRTQ